MSSIVAFSSVIAANIGFGSKSVDRCQRRNAVSLPLPLSVSTHTHTRACHSSDRSPVDSVGPGHILWTQFIRSRASIVHPLNSLLPPTRRLCHPHALCQPTSRRRMPVVQSLSLQSRLSPSRMTGSSSVIPEHVSLMSERQTHFMCSLPLPLVLASIRSYTPLKVIGDGASGTARFSL